MAKLTEVKLTLKREALEAAYAVLELLGITGLVVEDTALIDRARELGWGDYFPEVPASDLVKVGFYLEERTSPEKITQIKNRILAISNFGLDPGPVSISTRYIEEEDWCQSWKNHYGPQIVGRILIQPTWLELEDYCQADVVIRLDPGRAFGSGTHPTTVMCLNFLQEVMLENKKVWDLGTGSGILALVAAKLGAQVEAVDLDPIAVKVAKANRDLNGLNFSVRVGSLENLTGRPDLVVANIIADVIGPMIPQIFKTLRSPGYFVAAGVIESRDQEILFLAQESGFGLVKRMQQKEWVGYLFQKGG